MPKFKVTVNRVETRYQEVVVEATNDVAARNIAEAKVEEDDAWNDHQVSDVEITAINIEAVG